MPTDHLPARLMRAFERLDPATITVPDWPRSVRIGIDYALRVTGVNPTTDHEADSLAYVCYVRRRRPVRPELRFGSGTTPSYAS
jgi:hypothetical protein